MYELLAGMVGGIGLFFVGMWLLTENLKALASRRLRRIASRWTGNRLAACLVGAVGGVTTQSMSALTFIVVSMAKSGLVSTRGAFAIVLGGNIGATLLVFILTFDIKVVALYVLGAAGMVLVSERSLRNYRPIAASCFGVAMIVLGLVTLVDAAAPLADDAWFGEMLEWGVHSLLLTFLVSALLTAIVQSGAAVALFGISMATLGVLSVDQTIMLLYGIHLGAAVIQYLLSMHLTGRSRQVAMLQVGVNVLICLVTVPALFVEVYLGVPLMKALVLSIDQGLGQQMGILLLIVNVLGAVGLLTLLGPAERILHKLWPPTTTEELERPHFLQDGELGDVETTHSLVDLEQRRVLENLPRYFETVRGGGELTPLRHGMQTLLTEIERFQADQARRHSPRMADEHNAMLTRQKLLRWLEKEVAALCEMLRELPEHSDLGDLRTSVCEGTDAVFQSLLHAMETEDRHYWAVTKQLAGDRGDLMRVVRHKYGTADGGTDDSSRSRVIEITNGVEHVFFLLSKLVAELDRSPPGHRA